MRLDKLLEQEKIGSRKHVKQLFLRKQIQINGLPAKSLNQIVDPELQPISVENHLITTPTHLYYLLNKPKGVVTAVKDAALPTVIDLVHPDDQHPNLYPVGRLDRDSEGLILLTTNGPLGYRLLHPSSKVTKIYSVTVNASLDETDVAAFNKGVVFEGGYMCEPATLTIEFSSPALSQALVEINEGKFHQVKKMFLACGKKVTHLKRISMGKFVLPKDLESGEYRSLNEKEKQVLLEYF